VVKHPDGSLDAVFSALGDPTRRAILMRLERGAVSVGELARPFEISQPAVSRHLRVLEDAGLLSRRWDGRMRRCELNPEPMRGAVEWIARYGRFWEDELDALDRHIAAGGVG
jgi:DNA-binding transcriptional ArsR family regulator